MKNLAELNQIELKQFFNSFDNILFDCDGVLWTTIGPIKGVKESLKELENRNKTIGLVTNNCTRGVTGILEKLELLQLKISPDRIAYPTVTIIDYLQSINFNQEILLLGSEEMTKEIAQAGFTIFETKNRFEGPSDLHYITRDEENVGAVIVDIDFNLSYCQLQKAATLLKRKTTIFLVGATDKELPVFSPDKLIMGPHYLQDMLMKFTNRTPLVFGKPGSLLRDFLNKKYNLVDPSRTLFVGDTLVQDIGFGKSSGYKTLLVLTGATTFENLKNLKDKSITPDFYLESVGNLYNLINKVSEIRASKI